MLRGKATLSNLNPGNPNSTFKNRGRNQANAIKTDNTERHFTDILLPQHYSSSHYANTLPLAGRIIKAPDERSLTALLKSTSSPVSASGSSELSTTEHSLMFLDAIDQDISTLQNARQRLRAYLAENEGAKRCHLTDTTYVSDQAVVYTVGKGVKNARRFIKGDDIGYFEGDLCYRMPDQHDHSKPKRHVVFVLRNDRKEFTAPVDPRAIA